MISYIKQHRRISLLAVIAALALAGASLAYARQQQSDLPTPHIGYGINVAANIPVDHAQFDRLGFDWVMLYDIPQFAEFNGYHILYRTDVRGYPLPIDSWERDMHGLVRKVRAAGANAIAIGNEPNLAAEWGNSKPDPVKYTEVLCRAYRVIKQEAPDLIVVSAGLAPADTLPDGRAMNDFDFARQMLSAGAGRCFDVFGYHPYGFNQPPEADPSASPYSFRRAELMHDLLAGYGVYKQMWFTEFGWVRNPAEDHQFCADNPDFKDFAWMIVSAQTQADYTLRAYEYADANWPWVGPMFLWNYNWHQLPTLSEGMCSHTRWYSILGQDGSPLPAFDSLRQMRKRPSSYRPVPGAVVNGMNRTVEAGCAGLVEMGSFLIINVGFPGEDPAYVEVKPANGPNSPLVWASASTAGIGSTVTVIVDARKAAFGQHLIAVNILSYMQERMTSQAAKGYLILLPPISPECVQRYNAGDG
jgi:hypothetical protein